MRETKKYTDSEHCLEQQTKNHSFRSRVTESRSRLLEIPEPDPVIGRPNPNILQLEKVEFFLINAIFLFLGLHEELSSDRRSLHAPKENIPHIQT
jgi:hypothetical protein